MIDFNYEPLSEDQANKARYQLMDDGIYQGVIEHVEEKISSSNNPMGVFIVRVWDKEGKVKELKDYITFTPSMVWKLRHLCESSGLIKEFDEKKFRPSLALGKNVMVKIKTQMGKEIPYDKLNGNPPGTKYSDKNVIDDYVVYEKNSFTNNDKKDKVDEFFNDEVPF